MLKNIARGCTCARTKDDMDADIEHMNWIDSRMEIIFFNSKQLHKSWNTTRSVITIGLWDYGMPSLLYLSW